MRRGISRVANRSGIEDVVGIVILLVTKGRVSSDNLVVTVSVFNVDGGSFRLIGFDCCGRNSEALRHWLFFCGLVDGGGRAPSNASISCLVNELCSVVGRGVSVGGRFWTKLALLK